MTVVATAANPRFNVSRVDIDREGKTYTIDTLRDLKAEMPDAELFFITGADALADIFTWRDVEELFELANFVGCTRPGYEMDPAALAKIPADRVTMVEIPALAISSDRLPRAQASRRARLVPRARRRRAVHREARPLHGRRRHRRPPDQHHPPHQLSPAHQQGLRMTATDHALELVAVAAQAAHDKKADQVLAFDVSDQLAITDAFVLASANNERAVGAIVDEVEDKLREAGAKPIRREGHKEGRWVLLDYGEIVIHVQHEEERSFYALERLWSDCPLIPLTLT